jgi:hypothetical protein
LAAVGLPIARTCKAPLMLASLAPHDRAFRQDRLDPFEQDSQIGC